MNGGGRVRQYIRSNVLGFVAIFIALSGSAVALQRGEVKTKHIATGAVKAAKLANGAVKTPKLANGAVQGDKLADDAVNTGKIADGAVTSDGVLDDSLTGADVDESTLAGLDAKTVDGSNPCGGGNVGLFGVTDQESVVLCEAEGDFNNTLTLSLDCEASGGTVTASLVLETSKDGSFFDSSETATDQHWTVSEGAKTIIQMSDSALNNQGVASEMTSFMAAVPYHYGSGVGPYFYVSAARMGGTAMVGAFRDNSLNDVPADDCYAVLDVTGGPAY